MGPSSISLPKCITWYVFARLCPDRLLVLNNIYGRLRHTESLLPRLPPRPPHPRAPCGPTCSDSLPLSHGPLVVARFSPSHTAGASAPARAPFLTCPPCVCNFPAAGLSGHQGPRVCNCDKNAEIIFRRGGIILHSHQRRGRVSVSQHDSLPERLCCQTFGFLPI